MDQSLSTLFLLFILIGILCELLWLIKTLWGFILSCIVRELDKEFTEAGKDETTV